MAKAEELEVSSSDRSELAKWLRSSTARKSHVERARIILLSAEGLSAEAIGAKLDVRRITVYKWRRRYREGGVPALADAPRPGPPRKLTQSKVTVRPRAAGARRSSMIHWRTPEVCNASESRSVEPGHRAVRAQRAVARGVLHAASAQRRLVSQLALPLARWLRAGQGRA